MSHVGIPFDLSGDFATVFLEQTTETSESESTCGSLEIKDLSFEETRWCEFFECLAFGQGDVRHHELLVEELSRGERESEGKRERSGD